MSQEPTAFGKALRRHRLDRRWTQEELAERSGVSVEAVKTLERGTRRFPRRDTVERLANGLGLADEEFTAFLATARQERTAVTIVAATAPPPSRSTRRWKALRTAAGNARWRMGAAALLCLTGIALVSLLLTSRGGSSRTAGVILQSTARSPVIINTWGGAPAKHVLSDPTPNAWPTDGVAVGPSGYAYAILIGQMIYALRLSPDGRSLGVFPFDPRLGGIVGIAADSHGDLYATMGTGVVEFSPFGQLLTHWGTGLSPGRFSGASGIAIAPNGDVIVGEVNSHRIQVVTPARKMLFRWGGPGTSPQRFMPELLAADASGNVYVMDDGNQQIEKFTLRGKLLAIWRPKGLNLQGSPGGDIALDRDGHLWLTESTPTSLHIQEITTSGHELGRWTSIGTHPAMKAGVSGLRFTGAGYGYAIGLRGIAKIDRHLRVLSFWPLRHVNRPLFRLPVALATDDAGDLYVADDGSHQVIKISPGSGRVTTWRAPMSSPSSTPMAPGIAVDRQGHIFTVSSSGKAVDMYSPGGKNVSRSDRGYGASGSPLAYGGPAVDGMGNVTVVGYPDAIVRTFSPSGSLIHHWCASCDVPTPNTSEAMTVDDAGNVYIAFPSEIVEFSPRGVPLRSWRPRSLSGEDFDYAGLAVDANGDVYATNVNRNALQIFSPSGRILASWTTLGRNERRLVNPGAVTVDSRGDIFLVDGSRVAELAPLQKGQH